LSLSCVYMLVSARMSNEPFQFVANNTERTQITISEKHYKPIAIMVAVMFGVDTIDRARLPVWITAQYCAIAI
ncbi:hypothetical protein BLOT_009148, partial [Blomia tropicalis]